MYSVWNAPPVPTAVFRIKQGQIIYLGFELEKVPPEKRLTVSGRVFDESGVPVAHAEVRLSLGSYESRKEIRADSEGRYTFDSLAPHRYYIGAFKPGWVADNTVVEPPKETEERTVTVPDLVLFKPRKIVFDFVFQPDGSHDFTKGDLQIQTLEMTPYSDVLFKEGKVGGEAGIPQDLTLFVQRENLFFSNVWVTSGNGVYDAGKIPFDSVTEAKEGSQHYRPGGQPQAVAVEKDHVYVVHTYTGEYAKLIVREIITVEP